MMQWVSIGASKQRQRLHKIYLLMWWWRRLKKVAGKFVGCSVGTMKYVENFFGTQFYIHFYTIAKILKEISYVFLCTKVSSKKILFVYNLYYVLLTHAICGIC